MSKITTERLISEGVQHVIGGLDEWNPIELAVLKTGIALVEKRRELPDAIQETNRLSLARYAETVAEHFAGLVLDRVG